MDIERHRSEHREEMIYINARRVAAVYGWALRNSVSGREKMDAGMKELVAMGASAAANCHPCMEHHLAECDKLGIPREEVLAAVRVGLMVNHGAERAIRKHARKLLGEIATDVTA